MKKHISAVLALMLLIALASIAAAEPVRTTQYGQVAGDQQNDVEVYYGIPYGADPVGELRWMAPVAPEAWTEVRDCSQREPIALQMKKRYAADGSSTVTLTGTTDCLNLDIYTTADAQDLPVLVYVHGGNNQTGSSFDLIGNDLASQGLCVLVSLNYRTGLLGFNALPAITEEGTTGNYGMQDIAAALQWVRDNIAEFGGNPTNVTVSGFSAGGRDVMAMLISPAFTGLFDRAIAFSGGMTVCDPAAAAQKDAQFIAPLAVADGKATTEEDAAAWLMNDTQEVRNYLYSIDASRLAEAVGDAGIRMALFPHLYADDILLPANGFDGAYVNDVPVLMLTGTTEFSLFSAFSGYFFSIQDPVEREAARHFAVSHGSEFYRIFNTQLSAEKMVDRYQSNIYLCQINYGGETSPTQLPTFGSFHGVFVPMLSNTHSYTAQGDFTNEGYQKMAAMFRTYLKNFMLTGDPNSTENEVTWTPWTADSKLTMVMDANAETGETMVQMQDVTKSNEEIIAEIVADDSVIEPSKTIIIQTIMNGRWFSDDLDAYFNTPSLW